MGNVSDLNTIGIGSFFVLLLAAADDAAVVPEAVAVVPEAVADVLLVAVQPARLKTVASLQVILLRSFKHNLPPFLIK